MAYNDSKDGMFPAVTHDSQDPETLEKPTSRNRFVDNTDEDDEYTYEEQRKIIHRIDRRLVVILGLMYCVSLIDRGNMPNAAVAVSLLISTGHVEG